MSMHRKLIPTLFALACTVGACAGRSALDTEADAAMSANPDGDRVTIQVENRGFFDVAIYAMRSPSVQGARVATVNGGQSAQVRVRPIDLQPGNRLVLRLRALGTRATWTSGPLPVSAGAVARLDIQTSANGDLNQSSLYSQLAGSDRGAAVPATRADTTH